MLTLIVVKLQGIIDDKSREMYRTKLIKEMEEGLIVIDDNVQITSHSINSLFIGLIFNTEEERNEQEANKRNES